MSTIERFIIQNNLCERLNNKYNLESSKRKDFFNHININEFEKLSYEDAKKIMEISPFKYSDKNSMHSKLKEITEKKKYEKYPELDQAIYYPELNNIEFLNKEEIKLLDKKLRFRRLNEYIYPSSLRREMNITTIKSNQILEFLYDNKIVSKHYSLLCPECGMSMEIISEEDFKIYQEPYDDEKYDDYYHEMYCIFCEEFTSLNREALANLNKDVIYVLCKEPDLSKEGL